MGTTSPGTLSKSAKSRSRESCRMRSGRLTMGRGQVERQALDLRQNRGVVVGFADGDDGEVVLGELRGQRQARHHIKRPEHNIAAVEQELERRVGADIAGRGEGEELQRRRDRGARGAVDLVHRQRLGLARQTILEIAEELLDRGEVHERGAVVALINVFADELAPKRRQVLAVEHHLRQPRNADRGWLLVLAAHAPPPSIGPAGFLARRPGAPAKPSPQG